MIKSLCINGSVFRHLCLISAATTIGMQSFILQFEKIRNRQTNKMWLCIFIYEFTTQLISQEHQQRILFIWKLLLTCVEMQVFSVHVQ